MCVFGHNSDAKITRAFHRYGLIDDSQSKAYKGNGKSVQHRLVNDVERGVLGEIDALIAVIGQVIAQVCLLNRFAIYGFQEQYHLDIFSCESS